MGRKRSAQRDEHRRKLSRRLARLKRRLKAGAAIALALGAGTCVACGSRGQRSEDAGPIETPRPAEQDRPDVDETPRSVTYPVPTPPPVPVQAPLPAQPPPETTPDAGRVLPQDQRAKRPRVDRNQHRRGMPVPDNLLE
jgi:hypothetical protein